MPETLVYGETLDVSFVIILNTTFATYDIQRRRGGIPPLTAFSLGRLHYHARLLRPIHHSGGLHIREPAREEQNREQHCGSRGVVVNYTLEERLTVLKPSASPAGQGRPLGPLARCFLAFVIQR